MLIILNNRHDLSLISVLYYLEYTLKQSVLLASNNFSSLNNDLL